MHEYFKIPIPSKAILAPTIPYIGAFTSLVWKRLRSAEVGGGQWRSVAEIGGGGRWRRSVAEVGGGGKIIIRLS